MRGRFSVPSLKFEPKPPVSPGTVQPVGTTGKEIDPEGVNHPAHYNQDPSGVECIDIVRHRNFNVGNAIKYLWRNGLKTDVYGDSKSKQINDLEKAIFYIKDEIQRLKDEK